ncbi:hypothetical protein EV368DRAFT_61384 [Lentinula lateritia]|nr:hypothetical protein EV368DRAFT_61384 [Lentinula lateritia]
MSSSMNRTSEGLNRHTTYSPKNRYKLPSFCIDEARPMKVVIIGAGYSGIVAGIRFLQRIKNLELTIYEANAGIGVPQCVSDFGANPRTLSTIFCKGLACDIPSHCYQPTFTENPDWSSFYAPGPEIQAYLESVVEKFHLGPYIKLQHRLTRAQYNEKTGKWHLTIKRATASKDNSSPQIRQGTAQDEYEDIEDTADVLFTGSQSVASAGGSGRKSKDWKPIQIVPALQPRVKAISNFVLGEKVQSEVLNLRVIDTFTDKDKQKFRDKEYYQEFQRGLESDLNGAHLATLRGNPLQQGAREIFEKIMRQKLSKKPWIAEHWIEMVDDRHRDLDVIVFATGFNLLQAAFYIHGWDKVQTRELERSFFPISVFGEKCRLWYKVGKEEGRVVSLWPALENPRWEDYDYEPLDPDNNRFLWLGNGNTLADKMTGSDLRKKLIYQDYTKHRECNACDSRELKNTGRWGENLAHRHYT